MIRKPAVRRRSLGKHHNARATQMPSRRWHTHTDSLGGGCGIGVHRANLPAGACCQILPAARAGRQGEHEVTGALDAGGSELGQAAIARRARRVRRASEPVAMSRDVLGRNRCIDAAIRATAAVGRDARAVARRTALAGLELGALAGDAATSIDDKPLGTRRAAGHRDAGELAPARAAARRTHVRGTRRDRTVDPSTRIDRRRAGRDRVGRAIAALRRRGLALGIGRALDGGVTRAKPGAIQRGGLARHAETPSEREHEQGASQTHDDQEKSTGRAAV